MNYAALKTQLATYASETSDETIIADLTSTTSPNAVTKTVDTTGAAVRGVLYPRGSWDRVIGVIKNAYTGVPVAAQITCQNLVDMANQDASIVMTISAVASKIQADLTSLEGTKLSDGKGILWAADELATGDTGDSATLIAVLSQKTFSWADANDCFGVQVGDLQTARNQ